jgi:hypothetical protein
MMSRNISLIQLANYSRQALRVEKLFLRDGRAFWIFLLYSELNREATSAAAGARGRISKFPPTEAG